MRRIRNWKNATTSLNPKCTKSFNHLTSLKSHEELLWKYDYISSHAPNNVLYMIRFYKIGYIAQPYSTLFVSQYRLMVWYYISSRHTSGQSKSAQNGLFQIRSVKIGFHLAQLSTSQCLFLTTQLWEDSWERKSSTEESFWVITKLKKKKGFRCSLTERRSTEEPQWEKVCFGHIWWNSSCRWEMCPKYQFSIKNIHIWN